MDEYEQKDMESEGTDTRREMWGKELEDKQYPTRNTIGGLLDASWDQIEPDYGDCSMSTLDLARFYAPHFNRILQHKVGDYVLRLMCECQLN